MSASVTDSEQAARLLQSADQFCNELPQQLGAELSVELREPKCTIPRIVSSNRDTAFIVAGSMSACRWESSGIDSIRFCVCKAASTTAICRWASL